MMLNGFRVSQIKLSDLQGKGGCNSLLRLSSASIAKEIFHTIHGLDARIMQDQAILL